MNRNSQSHFAELPHENIQRSTFERPQNHKTTFNAGELIPFYIEQDVLPADTHKIKTTAIIRMSTPLHPTMDNAYIDIYYFFVPNRLLWEHWREFMGENRNGAWTQTTEYQVPQITFQDQTGFGTLYPVEKGDVAEKLGIPIGYNNYTNDGTISALPFRAYIQIWNRWFRDQNVTAPITEETGDGTHTISETSVYKKPQKVYKYHDYFTSALPAPQKGDAIQMPIGVAAPVNAPKAELINVQAQWYTQNGNQVGHLMSGVGSDKTVTTQNQTGYAQQLAMRPMGINGYDTWGGLYADLTQATAATVNALRLSVQIQRILEKDARGGTRYQEIIANHFKTTLPG
ncbi:MAG: hypothetical protein LBJ25_00340, partial [Candidatus Margulisbacteria bacterium]|nr:hypothetical protein [Candidatus Margulisiibacteriota bacterium]